jgi:hypothetical protein
MRKKHSMHFFTLGFIPADTGDMQAKVNALLAGFEYDKEVEAYKAYVTGKELHRMAARYGLLEVDLPALAEQVKRYFGAREGGIDEGGLFYISTRNQQGIWDYWVIGGRWEGILRKPDPLNPGSEDDRLRYTSCPVSELPDNIRPSYVVTPDGQGYQEDWWPESFEDTEQWDKTFHELLARYSDCLAVVVDCHS